MAIKKNKHKKVSVKEDYSILSENDIALIKKSNSILEDHFKRFIKRLKNFKQGMDFSEEKEMSKRLFSQFGSKSIEEKGENIKPSDYPKMAIEMEKVLNVYCSEQIDIYCTIDILNDILKKNITQRKNIYKEYTYKDKNGKKIYEDKIFYKMGRDTFEKRISYLKEERNISYNKEERIILYTDVKKEVFTKNYEPLKKDRRRRAKTKNIYVLNERLIKLLYGADLNYIHNLCELVLIPFGKHLKECKKRHSLISLHSRRGDREINNSLDFLGDKLLDFILFKLKKSF